MRNPPWLWINHDKSTSLNLAGYIPCFRIFCCFPVASTCTQFSVAQDVQTLGHGGNNRWVEAYPLSLDWFCWEMFNRKAPICHLKNDGFRLICSQQNQSIDFGKFTGWRLTLKICNCFSGFTLLPSPKNLLGLCVFTGFIIIYQRFKHEEYGDRIEEWWLVAWGFWTTP